MREGLSKQRIRDGFPLVQYASLYWTRHLKECLVYIKDATQTGIQRNPSLVTRAFLDLLRTLLKFLANKLFANTWVELQYMVCSHTNLPSHIDDLGEWCQLMESFPKNHLPEDVHELSTKIKYLHKDMLALNSAWGPTLEENPHYIWNDVTAFQECSSFVKTSAVTVRSMAPSQFDKRTLALKPLVSLSRERVDSELTGVLSIWPPRFVSKPMLWPYLIAHRLFEDAWPKITESVGDLPCEGWVARFEVWNVRSGAKEKVNDIRIPLDASKVKDHVDHSITLRKVFEGQKNRTTPTIFNKWSLSFPTAIGSDIDVLVILNAVYILDLSSNKFIQDIGLPAPVLETSSTSTEEGRVKSRKQPNPRPLRESLRLAWSYSFLVSDNGEYILRQDAKSLVSTHVGNPIVYSLTVIGFDQTRQTSYIIGQFGDNDAGIDINSCSFHPTLPLALFFTRCFGGGRNVVLWAFTRENHGKQQLSDPASSKSETLSNLGPPQTGIELLHFSACGKNVIVKCTGKRLPDVFSLEGNPVYTIALQLQQELHSFSSTTQAYSTDLTLLDNSNQSLIVPKQRIYQGQTLMTHSSSYQVNLSHRQTQSHLELSKVSDNIKIRQHLISFPDSWTDVDNSVNIALSNTGGADQNIKMVLNQGHKQWYDPTETREMHFPIIVEKDSRAFLQAESQNFGQGRKRSAAEMLKISSENEQLGDEQNSPKQRLIEYESNTRGARGVTSSYASFENDATGE